LHHVCYVWLSILIYVAASIVHKRNEAEIAIWSQASRNLVDYNQRYIPQSIPRSTDAPVCDLKFVRRYQKIVKRYYS
jgi:hypothetical protein